MLIASKHDWCHFEIRWDLPGLVKQMDNLTGFNKHTLKLSGLVLKKQGEIKSGYRLVSYPSVNKTGVSVLACGESFYGKISLAKRDGKTEIKRLGKARMHDLVQIDKSLGRYLSGSASSSPVHSSRRKSRQ